MMLELLLDEQSLDPKVLVRPGNRVILPDGSVVAPAQAGWSNEDGFSLEEYVPPVPDPEPEPTPEELRARMQPLTARQLRLGLIANSITLASVQTIIDGISDPVERETALVEWEYATTFVRLHPLIVQVAAALSLTPEQVDTMWEAALSL